MSSPSSLPTDSAANLTVGRRRWIDLLLIAAGIAAIAVGWPLVGGPLLAFGLVAPLLYWAGGRRRRDADLLRLVTPELAAAYRALIDAARLTGIPDADEVIDVADQTVLEAAALLAGRPPRGAAQRRFISARVGAMADTTVALRERHEAWTQARAEVDAISFVAAPDPSTSGRRDPLVGVLVVVLLPVFLAWDLVRALGHGVVALVDGLALRMRTLGCLVVRGVAGLGAVLGRVAQAWAGVRERMAEAVSEAHHRVAAARLRLRLRLRQARRAVAR